MIVTLDQPTVTVEHDDGTIETADFPMPSVGWGGGSAMLSPKRGYIAVVWDSGQSDAGCEVFALRPLRLIKGIPRVHGSGAIVAFSPDDRYLAMLSVVESMLDSTVSEDEQEIEWAELRVQKLPGGKIDVCSVSVTMPPIEEEGGNFYYPTGLRFKTAKTIELAGPSKALTTTTLPLAKSIEVDPP